MARYRYSAIDGQGRQVSGQIEASSMDDARAQLAAMGLGADSAVVEVDAGPAIGVGRISTADAAEVAWQVTDLAKAGLPLGAGLRAMAEEFSSARAKAALRRLADRLDAGISLDEALARGAPRLPEPLRCLLQAASRSGRFADVVAEMISLERTRSEVRQRLRLAFAYPSFLLILVLLLYSATAVVVPQFGRIYADFGTSTPKVTQVMLGLCSPQAVTLVWGLVVAAVFVGAAVWGARTRSALMQRLLYWMPIAGPIWRFSGLAAFARLMKLFLELEMPLSEALRMTARCLREGDLRGAAVGLATEVESGSSFFEAMARRRRFPATFRPWMKWGEPNAALADAFSGVARMCEGRIRFHGLVAEGILLPMILVLILAFGGMLIVSLMLPLVEVIQQLS